MLNHKMWFLSCYTAGYSDPDVGVTKWICLRAWMKVSELVENEVELLLVVPVLSPY